MNTKNTRTTQGVGEAIKNLGSDIGKNTVEELKNITFGAFDQLLDVSGSEKNTLPERYPYQEKTEKPRLRRHERFTIFRFTEYREQFLVKKRIEELVKMIREEAEALRKTTASITSELKEIEKAALENPPEKVGIYHVRFLEVILKLVRSLRVKASESKSWLETLLTRKKKRGSLFLALSKKKGTQYSLSEELKMARSVQ